MWGRKPTCGHTNSVMPCVLCIWDTSFGIHIGTKWDKQLGLWGSRTLSEQINFGRLSMKDSKLGNLFFCFLQLQLRLFQFHSQAAIFLGMDESLHTFISARKNEKRMFMMWQTLDCPSIRSPWATPPLATALPLRPLLLPPAWPCHSPFWRHLGILALLTYTKNMMLTTKNRRLPTLLPSNSYPTKIHQPNKKQQPQPTTE